ncbi:MAG TPA: C45 family autoproteolytic acyltransferase/hydrolase, partial [Candidatus Paceibacterota bacterium]|nr:C45 family autoproteolytic acyltransferase/hydrolase [Candidatus Paceibacterota bacterium]
QLEMGRAGQQLWCYAPRKAFGIVGSADVPRFATRPDSVDRSPLPPFMLPVPREQLILLPLLMQLDALPSETVDGARCFGMRGRPQPQAIEALKIPDGELRIWVRESDYLPARLDLRDGRGRRLALEFRGIELAESRPAGAWRLEAPPGARVETVALAHVRRFLPAALSILSLKPIPALGPATGTRRLLAAEGEGRLEDHDGTKVLFLKGTPEEMGRQHGVLLRREARNLVDRILYGVGVGSSFEKGRWFLGEIEEAQRRLAPFLDERHLREMDALADAAHLDREEVRLANLFPELFHCSGFALFGRATAGGRMYHGRILDYMRGIGLEPNAVVIVHQPEVGHAWVNVSYGGFVGSVTAMNERRISLGEMGGRGEGQWDGKPMSLLVREVMEKASTLEEGIEIMRRGPRTCEYYYVMADGNSKRAAGIAATPGSFEVIGPGQAHPRLPHAIEDAVLLSAGDRYEKLVERVRERYGSIDAQAALRLMERPVAMKSNIHSALFAPETLDLWVANADSENVASHCRFTHYNLAELLQPPAAPAR